MIRNYLSTGDDCCNLGDRVPAIFVHENEDSVLELVVATDLGNKPNNMWSVEVEANTWMNIEINQKMCDEGVGTSIEICIGENSTCIIIIYFQYCLEAAKNDDVFLNVKNPRPKIYENVTVNSGLSSNVVISNLSFESEGIINK